LYANITVEDAVNFMKVSLAVMCLLILAVQANAGDVVYTMWEDDQGMFWVRIQNDTDRSIRVGAIMIVFYDAKGRPIEERNVPCSGNCKLSPRDTRDFGSYEPPAGTESARVRNVRYSVE
jgi:hypothetical protein